MFTTTSSGFKDTPVSKALVMFLTIVPVLVSLSQVQYLFDLKVNPHLTQWGQWWRVFTWQLMYTSQSTCLFGALLVYNFRVLERLMGSRKYLSHILIIYVFTSIAVPSFLQILSFSWSFLPGFNSDPKAPSWFLLAPGPTAVVFALLVWYYHIIPIVYKFKVSPSHGSQWKKTEFSDKLFVYILVFNVAFQGPGLSSIIASLVSSLIGWIFGILLYTEAIPGRGWRIPLYNPGGTRAVSSGSFGIDAHRSDSPSENMDENDIPAQPLASQLFQPFRA
ncbi:hypothetical protein NADFUDRAFT_82444 [Nadsonia fulvescens var. elongata DSM 6958]|uniref:DUF1751-domain-containing protein n=1 Tax=Nadsonia fulvescens var. elongata DSM 6958 TaxID=857566 RepID=A0A1E3PMM6_9ASCO|nr:hypothetical protein NADFUDRAFT_82444 [Nadsonia fulvescens var. elongata DSM 6958]